MDTMNAAVVTSFEQPPQYRRYPLPQPSADQYLADVLAVGLHPRTRSGAAGTHYTSNGNLPMVPGIDGVGRRPDGTSIYFVAADDATGTMAEKALVDPSRAIELPPDVDARMIAAVMNPAMSSWVALRRRVQLEPGQSVLILGATGAAGSMAVQVAHRLGARHIVAAGRNTERLEAVRSYGADDLVQLAPDPAQAAQALTVAAEVDIVVDFLWGVPTQQAITALLTARTDRSRRLDWIQVGSVAGPTIELPSVALRSANLRLQGNGQGAISTDAYVAELTSLVEEIDAGNVGIEVDPVPLASVRTAWRKPDAPGRRTVLIP
jgi:NADPH:quinone reductase-like Zn-dependent oxidoreductase